MYTGTQVFLKSSRNVSPGGVFGGGRRSGCAGGYAAIQSGSGLGCPNDNPIGCWVQVRLDGVPIYALGTGRDAPDMTQYYGREFEAIEYYASGSQTPPEFSNGPGTECGVLVLWQRTR
jgi:hypothetical protein